METLTREELQAGLAGVGIQPGETILLHSRLFGLGRPRGATGQAEVCRFFLEAVLDLLGPEGTLVVPAYTTQVARENLPFTVEETIPNYGLLPEFVFNRPDFVRSLHPLESVAARGPRAGMICRGGGNSNYGARSPFDQLVRVGAKNVFLGLEIKEAVSLVHYIEMHYGVPYLYNKLLRWRPREAGRLASGPYTASVRYLDYQVIWNLDRFQEDLLRSGLVRSARVGGGTVQAVPCRELVEAGYDGLDRDLYYFLDAPPDFVYGRAPFDGPTLDRERAVQEGTDGREGEAGEVVRKISARAPNLAGLVGPLLENLHPGSRKALLQTLAGAEGPFLHLAEDLVGLQLASAAGRGLGPEDLARAYARFCLDTIQEQMEFRTSQAYSLSDYRTALEKVYLRDEVMSYYLEGLLLSQVLWDNHRRLLLFGQNHFFAPFCLTSLSHLEVGPGHGWLTLQALRFGAGRVRAFDVSPEALRMTEGLLKAAGFGTESYELRLADVQTALPADQGTVDTLVAGEVLEHLPDPAAFLREVRRVLAPGGAAWLTTAANAPAIDHLYLFRSVGEIRGMIASAGLEIERDLVVEAGRIGEASLENYGAVVRRGEG